MPQSGTRHRVEAGEEKQSGLKRESETSLEMAEHRPAPGAVQGRRIHRCRAGRRRRQRSSQATLSPGPDCGLQVNSAFGQDCRWEDHRHTPGPFTCAGGVRGPGSLCGAGRCSPRPSRSAWVAISEAVGSPGRRQFHVLSHFLIFRGYSKSISLTGFSACLREAQDLRVRWMRGCTCNHKRDAKAL